MIVCCAVAAAAKIRELKTADLLEFKFEFYCLYIKILIIIIVNINFKLFTLRPKGLTFCVYKIDSTSIMLILNTCALAAEASLTEVDEDCSLSYIVAVRSSLVGVLLETGSRERGLLLLRK